MDKKKVISIILGTVIIIISIIMPFHLKQVCYEFSIHEYEWSLDSCGAIQIYATIYGIIISALTLILLLLNIFKKYK